MSYHSSPVVKQRGESVSQNKSPWIAFFGALLALLSTLCTAYFYLLTHIYGTKFYISPSILFALQLL